MYDICIMSAVPEEDVVHIGNVKNLIRMRFGDIIGAVFGQNLLAQKFIKTLFTTPTKESPFGGGILVVIPENMTSGTVEELKPKVSMSISRAEADIIKQQIATSTPKQERLLSAKMLSLDWDATIRVLSMSIRIESMAGDAWVIQVPLASG